MNTIVITTAKNGTDYVHTAAMIFYAFREPISQFCINVSIINDKHREQTMQFFVVLNPSKPFPVMNNVTSVTIIDNDG